MADPPPRSGRAIAMNILWRVTLVVVALIVLIGIAVLIIWLTIRPKQLRYTVEGGSVENLKLSNTQLNASFKLGVRAYNPNTRFSVYYDYVTVTVGFRDQDLAFGKIKPFYQPHKDVTWLNMNLDAQNIPLHDSVWKDLLLKQAAGEMDFDVWIKARIRFMVGVWKSGHRTLRIRCSPVIVYLFKGKDFKKTTCNAQV